MTIDPRLYAIDRAAADREPTEVYADQVAVIVDNMMFGYLKDPARTDAMLRRDGMTRTADRLSELLNAKGK